MSETTNSSGDGGGGCCGIWIIGMMFTMGLLGASWAAVIWWPVMLGEWLASLAGG